MDSELTLLALDARRGDRDALAEFLRTIQPEVWRYCSAMVGNDDADDAAQEALTRIFMSMKRYEGSAAAHVWAMSITRHTCLDWMRRTYRRRTLADRLNRRPVDAPPQEHTWAELNELVDRLEIDRREAFVLTQVLGWPYHEAADACGCPVGTIRSRVARARLDLLGEYEAEVRRPDRRGPS